MTSTRNSFSASLKTLAVLTTALAVILGSGCSSVAPSKTARGAGMGATTGAVIGGVVGSASGANPSTGVLAGGAAGAVIGGIVGLTQEMKERKEQERLSAERAYQQDLARNRAEEAKRRAEIDEELAIAQGFRISDLELEEAQRRVDSASERLQRLRNERGAALAKKKALDEAQERLLMTEAEIARLEEELARLKGEEELAGETVAASESPPGSVQGEPVRPDPDS